MEFLRFGSSIPGSSWGCCACSIIQNFKYDPDDLGSIQLVSGDGWGPITRDNEMVFAGPTYRDIFWQRLRIGTFDQRPLPNHAFFAILTANQIKTYIGSKWLALLKEAGFEFLRSVSNSVYTNPELSRPEGAGSNLNHIFALFRNIGTGAPENPFRPPAQWEELTTVVPETWEKFDSTDEMLAVAQTQYRAQRKAWESHVPRPFLLESEIEAANVPVTLAGLRSQYPQESKVRRLEKFRHDSLKTSATDPFDPFDPFEPVSGCP